METTLRQSGLTLNQVTPFPTVFLLDIKRTDQYAPLCKIQGDLSDVGFQTLSLPESGLVYYKFEYVVKLFFDEGELTAYFEWKNDEVNIPLESVMIITYCCFRGIGRPALPQSSIIHLTLCHLAVW